MTPSRFVCVQNSNAIIPSSLAYSACLYKYEIIILRINQSINQTYRNPVPFPTPFTLHTAHHSVYCHKSLSILLIET